MIAWHVGILPRRVRVSVWSPHKCKWRRIGLWPGVGWFRQECVFALFNSFLFVRLPESRTFVVEPYVKTGQPVSSETPDAVPSSDVRGPEPEPAAQPVEIEADVDEADVDEKPSRKEVLKCEEEEPGPDADARHD